MFDVRIVARIMCLVGLLFLGGCVSGGGETAELRVAMPTDTYDTCAGITANVVEGVNFLSSGTGGGTVRLGMSECQLVQVLGTPTAVSPALAPQGQRHITMVYGEVDGQSTAYVFVNNSLKEMNRVSNTPQPLASGASSG